MGLSLIFMSQAALPFGFGNDYFVLMLVMLSAALSSIPDIDIKLEIRHRSYTHNILFGFIMGVIFSTIFGYAYGLWYGLIGFLGGFMGVILHLLGDILTYMPFKPLWPFSQKSVAFCLFKADSKVVNTVFFYLGLFAFFVYVIISSGAVELFVTATM